MCHVFTDIFILHLPHSKYVITFDNTFTPLCKYDYTFTTHLPLHLQYCKYDQYLPHICYCIYSSVNMIDYLPHICYCIYSEINMKVYNRLFASGMTTNTVY